MERTHADDEFTGEVGEDPDDPDARRRVLSFPFFTPEETFPMNPSTEAVES